MRPEVAVGSRSEVPGLQCEGHGFGFRYETNRISRLIDPVEEQTGILSGGMSLRSAAPLVIVPGFFWTDIRKNGQRVTGRFR